MKTPPPLRALVRRLWREWVRPLALPVLLITSAKSAIADINFVPSGSMKPTILEGDVVFINKLAYDLRVPFTWARVASWAEPKRGDIVVCFSPADGTRLVKRVIGLPGDTIEMRQEILFLNGVRQNYAALPDDATRDLSAGERQAAIFGRETLSGGRSHAVMALPALPALRDFGPFTVPAGDYFMLGDNRDNSYDSRYFGCIARRQIIGEAKAVFVSADPARWLQPRFDRFCTKLD